MPSERRDVAKSRLANKVIWGLEDILATCLELQRVVDAAMDLADEQMDPKMLRFLVRIDRGLTKIQRKAADARRGRYEQE